MSGVTWPTMKLFCEMSALVLRRVNTCSRITYHPVGRSTKSDTVRSLADGPDLRNNDPRARSPTVTEVDDKQPDHGHSRPASSFMSEPRVLVPGRDDSDDDVARRHTDSTNCENRLTAELVDVKDRWDGREPHGNAYYPGGEKVRGVARETKVAKNRTTKNWYISKVSHTSIVISPAILTARSTKSH